jgi:hypothetical protein
MKPFLVRTASGFMLRCRGRKFVAASESPEAAPPLPGPGRPREPGSCRLWSALALVALAAACFGLSCLAYAHLAAACEAVPVEPLGDLWDGTIP